MSTKTKGQKTALDNEGREARVPGYSMAVLWNMNAHDATVAALAFGEISEIPLDGDAGPRAAYRALNASSRWDLADAHLTARLRANHREINRGNR